MANKKNSTGIRLSRAKNPNKDLQKVRKDIRSLQNKTYAINRKISNAPSKYYARKYKKQYADELESLREQINTLSGTRSTLNVQVKEYKELTAERKEKRSKISAIDRQIKKAEENQDWEKISKLRNKQVKLLSEIDILSEKLGVKLNKPDVEDFEREDYEDDAGKGFILDSNSPYAIWEAIKQVNIDLESGEFKYIIMDGEKYSTKDAIQAAAMASEFWVTSKSKVGGTPYINRYTNEKTKTVKYLLFNS